MNDTPSNSTKYVIGIVIIIVLAIGAYLLFMHGGTSSPATDTTTITTTSGTDMQEATTTPTGSPVNGIPVATSTSGNPQASKTVTVTYTDQGFSPASVSINAGDTVKFVNQSANPMWVASDPHPLHNGYDGTTRDQHCAPGYTGPKPFDECSTAVSFSFTFTKSGTWGYHNHAEDQMQGTVIVH